MDSLTTTIGDIQRQLPKLRANKLKETDTRTKVINRLLSALGWNIHDCDSVAEEFPTVDGNEVDYALKLDGEPVVFVEAKRLNDSLNNIKEVTQVLNYATNANVAWCVLTNGIKWQVFKTHRRVKAQEKILFEIDLDPQTNGGEAAASLATRLGLLSRESLAKGMLEEMGNRIFLDSKVSAILANLLEIPHPQLLKTVSAQLADYDADIKPKQVKASLQRFASRLVTPPCEKSPNEPPRKPHKPTSPFSESHYLKGRPVLVVALYRELERFCQSIAKGITIRYKKCYIRFAFDSNLLMIVNPQKQGLKVWLKIDYDDINSPPHFTRKRSDGNGTELILMTREELKQAEPLIRRSFAR